MHRKNAVWGMLEVCVENNFPSNFFFLLWQRKFFVGTWARSDTSIAAAGRLATAPRDSISANNKNYIIS